MNNRKTSDILLLYVEDMLVGSTNEDELEFRSLSKDFKFTYLGNVRLFMEMEVHREEHGYRNLSPELH